MDAISALDTASSILSITEFIAGLLSASQTSLEGKDANTILETLKARGDSLHGVQNLPAMQQPWASELQSFSYRQALRELTSSREASTLLLEDLGAILTRSLDELRLPSQKSDVRAWLTSQLAGTPYNEKINQLSQVVTHQVSSILSYRISELQQALSSSENEERYARPEHESRIEGMSRDLEDLRLDVQRRSAKADTNNLTVFKEADVKLFRVRLARLTESENALLGNAIASSLNYNSRPVRFDSIPQAHKDTFQWAFDSRLSDWFSTGSGTFWISGKPGSGKSTFMKYISSHPRTKELLAGWAGSSKTLAVAAHFFWIAGTPIQKSWQGLLQSLLFDLLRGHSDLVSLVSPNRWAAAKAGRWPTAAEPWSVTELAGALRILATADHVPLKICFFIDGLDEYDSNHAELCEVLRDMSNSPHIKICLSSRRWEVFEKSFGDDTQESLDIHELTRNDIRKFVNDQLQSHSGWQDEVCEEVTLEKAELVDRIVAQADGVFLWAFFVTRSLRESLTGGERIGDLNNRVNQLPSDLNQLFQHMLENVNAADHPKMAGILQATVHALEPLHVDLYWHLEKGFEDHRPTTQTLVSPETPTETALRKEQTIRSINDKTKGLLRLVYDRVEFLHRTVKDFVLTKDVGEYLRSKLPQDYNGFFAIATAYLSYLRTTWRQDYSLVASVIRQGRGMNTGPFIAHLNQALAEELLDEYEAAVMDMVSLGHVTIRGSNSHDCDRRLLFREELLKHDLAPYLAKKIRDQPDFFDVFDESPLFAALTPMSRSSGESPGPIPGILDILLRRGEDPNVLPRQLGSLGVSDTASPWVLFSRSTMSVFNMLSGPCMFPALRWNASLTDATFSRLMSHGADPNMPLLDRLGARTVFSHFLDISLSKFLGEECFEEYLVTLDAFLRAGASLGIPKNAATAVSSAEVAFGNLARRRPEESVLASFCTELKGLQAKLSADPHRAKFVSSVVEKLVLHCAESEEDLGELKSAILQGCPDHVAEHILQLVNV